MTKKSITKWAIGLAVVAILFGGSLNANAKKIDTGGMDINDSGLLRKYNDVADKKHSITIPGNVQEIEDEAFLDCKYITEIKFEKPEKLKKIGKNAFSGCIALKSFTVPKNIDKLDEGTFNGCTSLKEIKFNNKLLWIGTNCFLRCKSLKSVKLPKSLEYLGEAAFVSCDKLTKVEMPQGLAVIGDRAFAECKNLKIEKGLLPIELTSLGARAFQNCTSLKEMTVYSNVGYLGESCFSGCESMEKITFKDTAKKVGKKKSVEVSDTKGIRELRDSLFANCKKLKTVTIGNNFIENIAVNIFNGCAGTIKIKAPEWVFKHHNNTLQSYIDDFNDSNVKLKAVVVK